MLRAAAVHELFLRLERFTSDAVPPFVHALVNVACVVNPLHQFRDGRLVPRLRRPDEVVIRQIEAHATCFWKTSSIRSQYVERIEALLRRTLVDILRVLVVAHQKERVDAAQPLVPRDDVGTDLLVGRAQMWDGC